MRGSKVVRARDDAEGSVLLEAVTGIAMLAVLSVALLVFQTAASDAAVRSEALAAATRGARDLLEERQSLHEDAAMIVSDEMLSAESIATAVEDGRCGSGAARVSGIRTRSEVAEVSFGGALGPRPRSVVPSGSVVSGATVVVGASFDGPLAIGVAGQLDVRPESHDAVEFSIPLVDGCGVLDHLSSGRHAIVHRGSEILVDAGHRPTPDVELALSVLAAPVRHVWDLLPATMLSVEIDTDGARPPDTVSSGALRWSVRGDDLREMRELGEQRPVRPGRVVAVVTACRNPEAAASARSVDLPIGGESTVTLPLATITVQGVAAWPDATLMAARTTTCADGSGFRPALSWSGGLHDGMRIALPNGEWEALLQTATGTRISGPVRFLAGAVDAIVILQ
jgi:type II secretory pathway pseudopilin PulG